MSATPWPTHARTGLIQRALARMYERLGARILIVHVACGIALAVVTGVVMAVVGQRYLRLSQSDFWLLFAIALPIVPANALAAVFASRGLLRTVLSWSGEGRTAERAPEVWNAIVRLPYVLVSRAVLVTTIALVPVTIAIVVVGDAPAYSAVPIFVGMALGMLAGAVLSQFGAELMARPMLEDVAAHLPTDFQPSSRAWRLRTKALAPLPIVTAFSALAVGAFVDVSASGPARLTIAVGLGLATIALTGLIFLVVTRSVLDPLDELLAATRRVGEGDIATPVPVVTADDLGELAASFNHMLAGLRERESLREHNLELNTALQASLEDVRRQAGELRESRTRIVAAADGERRRAERDLHDGAQQHLVLLQLKLGKARHAVDGDAEALAIMEEAQQDLARALAELRDLAHGIYPAVLENDGLAAALEEAAHRAAIRTEVECDGAGRYRPELEAAVYFCCLEALQNAAKHAGEGARASVRLGETPHGLAFEISDDGRGYDPAAVDGSAGLQNMTDRIGALGGVLEIKSAPGAGTAVAGTVPLAEPRT